MNKCKDVKGFYKALHIEDFDSSYDDIKKGYRNLAKIFHPDKDTGDVEKFQKIQEAYDTLSDETKRNMYDNNVDLDNAHEMFELSFVFDMQDVFQNLFHNVPKPNERPRDPIKKVIKLTLDDVLSGCKKHMSIEKASKCPKCGPDGNTHSGLIQCLNCRGRGFTDSFAFPQICPSCNGESIIRTNLRKCGSCNGTSCIRNTVTILLPIEAGTKHNSTIFLKDENAVVEFKYAFDSSIKIKGPHVHVKHPITIEDALVGFSHKFPYSTLDGTLHLSRDDYFDVSLPEIIKGKGVRTGPATRGDLHIHYLITGTSDVHRLHKFKRAFVKMFSTKASTLQQEE